jgi:hypothetical protein
VFEAGAAFQDVFESTHSSESDFSDELFKALRKTLGDTFNEVPGSKGKAIVLKNQGFGFAENYSREGSGYSKLYALSTKSCCDHCVLVFPNTFISDDGTEFVAYEHNDVTAVVELKMSDTSCKEIKAELLQELNAIWKTLTMDRLVEMMGRADATAMGYNTTTTDTTAVCCMEGQFAAAQAAFFYVVREIDFPTNPDLKSGYGPLAQTIMYGLDVFHCLARRGLLVILIPLTIVAGFKQVTETKKRKADLIDADSTGASRAHLTDTHAHLTDPQTPLTKPHAATLCCVDAHLNIPQVVGEAFSYTIKHQIPFELEYAGRMAAATYLRTLCEGVKHAIAIEEGRRRKPWPNPKSLCGVVTDCIDFCNIKATGVSMIACPIPGAHLTVGASQEPFGESIADAVTFRTTSMHGEDNDPNQKPATRQLQDRGTDVLSDAHGGQSDPDPQSQDQAKSPKGPWSIRQGELFRCHSASFSTRRMGGAVFSDAVTMAQPLIKISCVTVHSTLVPLHVCHEALSTLSSDSEQTLKDEIAKVLCAVAYNASRGLLATAMKDLTLGGYSDSGEYSDIPFGPLEHEKIRQAQSLPNLWSAVESLVKTVLLPMARLGIVHMDIRPYKEETHNIMFRMGVDGNMELRLVDYESLAPITHSTEGKNHPAINSGDLRQRSALEYLWWQMLWLAFVWQSEDPPKDSSHFIKFSFKKLTPHGKKFHTFVGHEAWNKLSPMYEDRSGITEAYIMKMMSIISKVIAGHL